MENEDKPMENGPNEKEMEMKEDYYPTQETDNKKETIMSETELEMDHDMTQSETDVEDHELQEIPDKEHPDLEGFLMQGTTGGIDSLPQEDCKRIQQMFLWKTEERGLDKGKTIDKHEQRGVKTLKSTPGLATRNAGKNRVGKSRRTS